MSHLVLITMDFRTKKGAITTKRFVVCFSSGIETWFGSWAGGLYSLLIGIFVLRAH